MRARRTLLVTTGLMVAATAILAATSLLAKAAGTDVSGPALHPLQVTTGRFLFGLLALLPFLVARWPGTTGLPLRLHVGRVGFGWAGATFLFAASARLPLGDANAISFLAPVVTMALSIPALGERVGRDRWAAAGVSLSGALILAAPGTSAFQPAAGLALASALLIGAELVFIKRLATTEPALRVLAMSNGIGLILSGITGLFVWQAPTREQWLILAALGTVMVAAQGLFVQANRRSDASYLAPIFYAVPLFAALYDFLVFGQGLAATSAIGMALIVAGAVGLTIREASGAEPAGDPATDRAIDRAIDTEGDLSSTKATASGRSRRPGRASAGSGERPGGRTQRPGWLRR